MRKSRGGQQNGQQMALFCARVKAAEVSREAMRAAYSASQFPGMGYTFEQCVEIREFAGWLRLHAAVNAQRRGAA